MTLCRCLLDSGRTSGSCLVYSSSFAVKSRCCEAASTTPARTLRGPARVKSSGKGFCRNPRGIFPTKTLGEFCGGFSGGFFWGLFPWEKQDEKIHQKIPRKIQIRIWEFRRENPHCKDLALRNPEIQEVGRRTYSADGLSQHMMQPRITMNC